MQGTIKARLAETEDSTFYQFDVLGYGIPAEAVETRKYEWYYLNANGFAQMFNHDRPPSKYPTPARLLLTRVPVEPK